MLSNNATAGDSGGMVKYQFEIEDDEWERWKETVPRSKALDQRIRELIQADADGRVMEETDEEPAPTSDGVPSEPAVEEPTTGLDPAPVDDGGRERLIDEVPSSGELAERRADEVLKMYDLLRRRGGATKSELLDAVDVEATEYENATSVWSNMVKGKDTLRALPGVETPPEGKSKWKYTGGCYE